MGVVRVIALHHNGQEHVFLRLHSSSSLRACRVSQGGGWRNEGEGSAGKGTKGVNKWVCQRREAGESSGCEGSGGLARYGGGRDLYAGQS